jgi:magnesium-protoporphyrin O-methyltransferase
MAGAPSAPASEGAYLERRARIEEYFDRTASQQWARMTSDAPLGRIRSTVREGRDAMRRTLLEWLPADLTGKRVLDAGCGTGALAVEAARRGAEVVAVDLSPTLIDLARERTPADLAPGSIAFHAGDMLDPELGFFDHVVAMDSLIHYTAPQLLGALRQLSPRVGGSILFTIAPRTPLLAAMHAVGRFFPRGDRAPAIEPVAPPAVREALRADGVMHAWQWRRTRRVGVGFYTSQAVELACP